MNKALVDVAVVIILKFVTRSLISNAVLIVIGLSNCPIIDCPITNCPIT